MALLQVELYLLIVLIASIYLYIFYKQWTDPLLQIPTIHWSAPFSRRYILWQIYQDRRRYALYDAHMKADGEIIPLVRVGPNEVSIMTTQGIKRVYAGGSERTSHYTAFRNFGTSNMFSFIPRSAHIARKRIFALVYSRSSIHSPRVQHILNTRTTKLVEFLLNQTNVHSSETSGYLIPRNFFSADILTAFAFSDAEGTNVIDELQAGANTMEEIGIGVWELWHEDKRDSFHLLKVNRNSDI